MVAQRVAELEAAGLVVQAGRRPLDGRRAPRQVRLRPEAGVVAGADLRLKTMHIGIADLDGRLLASQGVQIDIADGPETVLALLEQEIERLAEQVAPARLWGIGVAFQRRSSSRPGAPSHHQQCPCGTATRFRTASLAS